jgi:hypothetical protein
VHVAELRSRALAAKGYTDVQLDMQTLEILHEKRDSPTR